MSRGEAVKKANMQYLVVNPIVSFAGGALSGLVPGGGGAAINSLRAGGKDSTSLGSQALEQCTTQASEGFPLRWLRGCAIWTAC